MTQQGSLTAVRDTSRTDHAVVFIHGFSGDSDDTWDRFPALLGSAIADCDIYSLGYATTFLPDVTGVWSADPDIPIIATLLRTRLGIDPLARYQSIRLVAHSMGGLVVQKALVDDPSLCGRVSHVVLFGTPSAGLKKARTLIFWKRQLLNMAVDSAFITGLRSAWSRQFAPPRPFRFLTVAGTKDQFVPPASSLEPFEAAAQRVVPGDHLAIVKPAKLTDDSVQLLVAALSQGAAPSSGSTADPLRLAAERADPGVERLVRGHERLSQAQVVDAALALDRAGKRHESVALLEENKALGTDVAGTLAGRFKRMWLESGDDYHAKRALALYESALAEARTKADHAQIHYHAINVAFLNFVAFEQPAKVREMAELAQSSAGIANDRVWSLATQAEAKLYLGDVSGAIALYRRVKELSPEPWQLASTGLQAAQIAGKLGNAPLLDALREIFSPDARRSNKIFVSYSHKDADWLERLRLQLKPYLRQAESELDLWDDTRIRPGDQWETEIRTALGAAGVAVALVSANFLGSSFVVDNELPVIVDAARRGDLRLIWLYLSPVGYEATPLAGFQAAHDTRRPLAAMSHVEAEQVLKDTAAKIREATLSATRQFAGK